MGKPTNLPSGAPILAYNWTIPTVNEWAMIILTLSMLIGGTLVIRRRREVVSEI